MASDFSLESVKQCVLDKGGRIRNHELVTQFKAFLNDPVHKGTNREKFKDFVNELATIKVEEGEKILVLKRKYRPENTSSNPPPSSHPSATPSHPFYSPSDSSQFQPPPAKSPHRSDDPSEGSYSSYSSSAMQDIGSPQSRQYQDRGEPSPMYGDAMRARSEPPGRDEMMSGPREADGVDGMMMSKVSMGVSDDNIDVRFKSSTRQNLGPSAGGGDRNTPLDVSMNSLTSSATGSQGSISTGDGGGGGGVSGSGNEEDGAGNESVMSIKDRVLHLNKISSESDLQSSKAAITGSAPAFRKKPMKDRDDDDESHSSGGTSYVTLTPEEKEWMLISATADYHEMFKLLNKNGKLAKVKDISNGYTALHWAAKFGKPEVVKMLSNKIVVNVNQRSNGGYTPLHLAAIHGHEEVIDLLISVYKADPNIRDYSGKKAKQYLKNSASSRAQRKPYLSFCGASGDLVITPRQGGSGGAPTRGRSNRDSGGGIVHLSMNEAQIMGDGSTLV